MATEPVQVVCLSPQRRQSAARCAQQLGQALCETESDLIPYRLVFSEQAVVLRSHIGGHQSQVMVDFCSGSSAYRRHAGGGKSQLIAKAVGLHRGALPSVCDATAGLGADAFVLASLGCRVTLVERSPIASALLADGIRRARDYGERSDPALLAIVERMELVQQDSLRYLRESDALADVIYLDPMFPPRSKKAAVKKQMQMFHDVVGRDADADDLLALALQRATHRVVVKRPRLSQPLGGAQAAYQLAGKSSRYDVYPLKRMDRP